MRPWSSLRILVRRGHFSTGVPHSSLAHCEWGAGLAKDFVFFPK